MDRNTLINIQRPADVFGDVRVVQSIPKMNLSFPYGLDTKQTHIYGNVYHANSMCNLAVSNVSNMISVVESTLIETSPNTSLNCRFDAVFGNKLSMFCRRFLPWIIQDGKPFNREHLYILHLLHPTFFQGRFHSTRRPLVSLVL